MHRSVLIGRELERSEEIGACLEFFSKIKWRQAHSFKELSSDFALIVPITFEIQKRTIQYERASVVCK